ncbi:MAG: hypothetical protein VKJ24_17445 [Synechococcales bacterium]|nr:hypothetical protein [Synechococcales bacterium]
MKTQRPLGITLLASWQFISSGFGIFGSLSLLIAASFEKPSVILRQLKQLNPGQQMPPTPEGMNMMITILKWSAAFGLVLGLIGILLGYGLWKLQNWVLFWVKLQQAWNLFWNSLSLLFLITAHNVLSTAENAGSTGINRLPMSSIYVQLIMALLLNLAILVYLSSSEVRNAFLYRQQEVNQLRYAPRRLR